MLSNSVEEQVKIEAIPQTNLFKRWRLEEYRLEAGLLLVLLVAALGLRLYNLTRLSFWFDEAHDVMLAYELPFWQTLTFHEPYIIHPPFFFTMMHLWTHLFGLGEIPVRLFSVISAIATLLIIYFMVRRWINQQVAFTSTLLLAVSPLHVYWSQNTRGYANFALMVTISMALALLITEKPKQNWLWALYGLSGFLLIYTQYPGFHVIFAQTVFFLIMFRKNWGALLRLAITLALIGAAFLPYFGYFLEQTKISWTGYLLNSGPSQLLEMLEIFNTWFVPQTLIYMAGALFIPLYILGLVWLWKNRRKMAILLACWSLLPGFTSWLSSLLQPNFVIYYYVFCVPAYMVAIAAGVWSLQGPIVKIVAGVENRRFSGQVRILNYGLIVLLVGVSLLCVNNYYKKYTHQDWRAVANNIISNRQEGDVIFLANPWGFTQRAFDYYYVNQYGEPGKLERRSLPEPIDNQMVADVFKDAKRVWAVSLLDGSTYWVNDLKPRIPANFKVASYKQYDNWQALPITLTLYVKKD